LLARLFDQIVLERRNVRGQTGTYHALDDFPNVIGVAHEPFPQTWRRLPRLYELKTQCQCAPAEFPNQFASGMMRHGTKIVRYGKRWMCEAAANR
jgi:hypothetical protein